MPKYEEIAAHLDNLTVFGSSFSIPSEMPTATVPTETAERIKEQFSAPHVTNTSNPVDFPKSSGKALKFDSDKLPLNLLSTEAMNQTAAVLKFGAEKYAEHNWRKGFAWSRPLAAAMRHITAFNDGEDCDPESGLSHLAHAACCIMFLLEFQKTHPELDDRYKPVQEIK